MWPFRRDKLLCLTHTPEAFYPGKVWEDIYDNTIWVVTRKKEEPPTELRDGTLIACFSVWGKKKIRAKDSPHCLERPQNGG